MIDSSLKIGVSPIVADYGFAALILVMTSGLALLAIGLFLRTPQREIDTPPVWAQFRFGYGIYALIFLAFDMEMIFMYPWAVVFADIGISAFLDMLVFIVLLGAGIGYAWGMGGLKWDCDSHGGAGHAPCWRDVDLLA